MCLVPNCVQEVASSKIASLFLSNQLVFSLPTFSQTYIGGLFSSARSGADDGRTLTWGERSRAETRVQRTFKGNLLVRACATQLPGKRKQTLGAHRNMSIDPFDSGSPLTVLFIITFRHGARRALLEVRPGEAWELNWRCWRDLSGGRMQLLSNSLISSTAQRSTASPLAWVKHP